MLSRILEGTMNRKRYILYNMGLAVVVFIILVGMVTFLVAKDVPEASLYDNMTILVVPAMIICTVAGVVFDVKRLRHIGADVRLAAVPVALSVIGLLAMGNELIGNVISAASTLIFIALCLIPGKKTEA